jgi:hypothetical protein
MYLCCTRIEWTVDPKASLLKTCCQISWILSFGATNMNAELYLNGMIVVVSMSVSQVGDAPENRCLWRCWGVDREG